MELKNYYYQDKKVQEQIQNYRKRIKYFFIIGILSLILLFFIFKYLKTDILARTITIISALVYIIFVMITELVIRFKRDKPQQIFFMSRRFRSGSGLGIVFSRVQYPKLFWIGISMHLLLVVMTILVLLTILIKNNIFLAFSLIPIFTMVSCRLYLLFVDFYKRVHS